MQPIITATPVNTVQFSAAFKQCVLHLHVFKAIQMIIFSNVVLMILITMVSIHPQR